MLVRDDVMRRVAEIGEALEPYGDVRPAEPLLIAFAAWLGSLGPEREQAAKALVACAKSWPAGGVEAAEFAMRAHRWGEVRAGWEQSLSTDLELRTKEETKRALEVYETKWPGGEIYATYDIAG